MTYVSTISSCQILANMPSSCLARCHLPTLRPQAPTARKENSREHAVDHLFFLLFTFCRVQMHVTASHAFIYPLWVNIHQKVSAGHGPHVRPHTSHDILAMGLWHHFLKLANPPQFSLPFRVLDKTLEQHSKLQIPPCLFKYRPPN